MDEYSGRILEALLSNIKFRHSHSPSLIPTFPSHYFHTSTHNRGAMQCDASDQTMTQWSVQGVPKAGLVMDEATYWAR